jgi:phosphatidylserine/phosphatidylglycerophosphate/cardiolipin synthase-like enzyme
MDFKGNPLLLLCIGFLIGIVVAEAFYIIFSPIVPADGSVAVVVDRDYFPQAIEAISSARETVHVVMFSANYQTSPEYSESSVNRILEQLVAAHNKGVEVSIIMDDWPEGNDKTMNYLQRNNVKVREIIAEGSTHAKLIIVDGRLVIVGSTNWSHHSLDLNREANVLINDESIAQRFESYFDYLTSIA